MSTALFCDRCGEERAHPGFQIDLMKRKQSGQHRPVRVWMNDVDLCAPCSTAAADAITEWWDPELAAKRKQIAEDLRRSP